jgi:hypothetical protein
VKINKPPAKLVNPNSILAKFREDIIKRNSMIEQELQKTADLNLKYDLIRQQKRRKETVSIFSHPELGQTNTDQKDLNSPNISVLHNSMSNFSGEKGHGKKRNTVYDFHNSLKMIEQEKIQTSNNLNNSDTKHNSMKLITPGLARSSNDFKTNLNLKSNDPSILNNRLSKLSQNSNISKINNQIHNSSQITNFHKPKISKVQSIYSANANNILYLNKNNTSTTKEDISSVKKENKEYSRMKNYKVALINNWNEKVGIPVQHYSIGLVSNLEFQSGLIVDEIKVLLDNFHYFKLNFMHNKEVAYLS